MRRWIIAVFLGLYAAGLVSAQEENLIAEGIRLTSRLDAFGLEQIVAQGVLINRGDEAYRNISLLADVYDADENLIGEGFGYLVRACGEALVADFALQPGHQQRFAVQLDIFEPEAEIDRVDILPQAQATEPADSPEGDGLPGIRRISDAEVVELEWIYDPAADDRPA